MLKRVIILLCVATPALAQQLPPLDPAVQLGICQQQRARFLSDSEQAQAYATQFMGQLNDLKKAVQEANEEVLKVGRDADAQIADLKKRLAEAEARLPKTEPKSEVPSQ